MSNNVIILICSLFLVLSITIILIIAYYISKSNDKNLENSIMDKIVPDNSADSLSSMIEYHQNNKKIVKFEM